MRIWIGAACAACLLAAAPAAADDSSAALGMGGLVLTKNDNIRMAREDLRISPTLVTVRYEFVNDSAKDIDTIVAFPLPNIDLGEYSESPIGTIVNSSPNFVGFQLKVDGRTVGATAEERAMLKGRDVTALVKGAGLPVNMAGTNLYDRLPKLPLDARKRLVAAGLLDIESEKGPDINGSDFHPLWTAVTKFWWHQRFPAGKTVVIEHRYQPVTGQAFFGADELDPKNESGTFYSKNYCFDAGTRSALRAKLVARKGADPQNGDLLTVYSTDFILKTANNWKGGIGHFHLTLDKVKPDNVISLCWDGELKKAGPTTFETNTDHFAPKRDVHMIVVQDKPSP